MQVSNAHDVPVRICVVPTMIFETIRDCRERYTPTQTICALVMNLR
jgi:hypothetical protein